MESSQSSALSTEEDSGSATNDSSTTCEELIAGQAVKRKKRGTRLRTGNLFQRIIAEKERAKASGEPESSTIQSPNEPVPSASGQSGRGGRGKGRGRGRGRGRGGGATSVRQQRKKVNEKEQKENAERIEKLLSDRDAKLQETISSMSERDVRELLLKACKAQPGLIFSLCECNDVEEGHHPDPGSSSPEWCKCGNCRDMPTVAEQLCCQCAPEKCISKLPEMELLILEPTVLTVANNYRNDVFALDAANIEDYNKSMRHGAYRQYILWRYGYLGEGNRRVIPSCVVWRIRDKYKSKFGQYTGYKPGRLI